MATATAARGSRGCVNSGGGASPLLCKCVRGACAQHPGGDGVRPGSGLDHGLWEMKERTKGGPTEPSGGTSKH